LLEQQIKNLQIKIMLFFARPIFSTKTTLSFGCGKGIAPFNLSSTTPFHDRFFFPLSERLGLNENTFSSFALLFRPPFPTARPSQTKPHGIYFVFRM
jgi:hypothetical protein